MCLIGDKPYLYSGFITEFYLDENGLDNLYFENYYRRKLDEEINDHNVTKLQGNLFMIPSETIKNVHITYCEYVEISNKSLQEVYAEIEDKKEMRPI